MWDLPGPGMETKSPALAGGFFPTGPPGKPYVQIFYGLQRPFIPTFAESPSLAVPMLSTTKWSLGDNVDINGSQTSSISLGGLVEMEKTGPALRE